MSKHVRDWYAELSGRLDSAAVSANWLDIHLVCDKIVWAWKYHKITDAQKDELCNKAIEYLNG